MVSLWAGLSRLQQIVVRHSRCVCPCHFNLFLIIQTFTRKQTFSFFQITPKLMSFFIGASTKLFRFPYQYQWQEKLLSRCSFITCLFLTDARLWVRLSCQNLIIALFLFHICDTSTGDMDSWKSVHLSTSVMNYCLCVCLHFTLL